MFAGKTLFWQAQINELTQTTKTNKGFKNTANEHD